MGGIQQIESPKRTDKFEDEEQHFSSPRCLGVGLRRSENRGDVGARDRTETNHDRGPEKLQQEYRVQNLRGNRFRSLSTSDAHDVRQPRVEHEEIPSDIKETVLIFSFFLIFV